MRALKIACSDSVRSYFSTLRAVIPVNETDYTDIAAAVLFDTDEALIDAIYETRFGIPVFVFTENPADVPASVREKIYRLADVQHYTESIISNEIETAASQYEGRMLPPFFESLSDYMELNNLQFDCPGHQSGQYFKKHPAGRYLYEFYGELIFKSDICNSDVAMGDLLIHEGPPSEATKNAAKVFNADETFFILNGTSTSNSVAIGALVTPGDLVLFDRNNHKSVYDAALIKCGGLPVYLETARNPLGFIGGIDEHCFDEGYIRERLARICPDKATAQRPFRLAAIQLGTYDGTIYNARQVVDKIGHLCDYILFDSAWVGYEQFIPMMRDCSPLLLELTAEDPGILVTQSVHKQQAGFSQTSYIHKKDNHIAGQKRYVDHKRFNNSYRLNASTSPFYPLYASLDVNARMQDRESGRKLWDDCVRIGIETRKRILRECSLLKPFVPPVVRGRLWEEYDTDEIARSVEFFQFESDAKWHSFEGYGDGQYFVDPNKLMLTTPGIDLETGDYTDFGIPATILASYLRDNRIIPEKNDFNSILFLLTPAETVEKMDSLIAQLVRFERLMKEDASLSETLPLLYAANIERYRGYSICELCKEMHDFYKTNESKTYQQRLFREATFPEQVLTAQEANYELVRNNAKLVRIADILGEIALEGALPYPPGIFCVAPGERWSETAQRYFLILEEGINRFPGFSPEIHGVFLEGEHARKVAYGYVLDRKIG
ncbi:MAG: ornithine decarboxylase [Clostridiales Family XIII bacterium]|jgi:ornithine decarboxylase|nr:ornithine decarboxylase [Clostridiales Family XIII bacterium]